MRSAARAENQKKKLALTSVQPRALDQPEQRDRKAAKDRAVRSLLLRKRPDKKNESAERIGGEV
jgi:hypothetical protein